MNPKNPPLTQQILDVLEEQQPLKTDALVGEAMRRACANDDQRLRYRGAVYQLSKIGVIGEASPGDDPTSVLGQEGGKVWIVLRQKAPRGIGASAVKNRKPARVVAAAPLPQPQSPYQELQSIWGIGSRIPSEAEQA